MEAMEVLEKQKKNKRKLIRPKSITDNQKTKKELTRYMEEKILQTIQVTNYRHYIRKFDYISNTHIKAFKPQMETKSFRKMDGIFSATTKNPKNNVRKKW